MFCLIPDRRRKRCLGCKEENGKLNKRDGKENDKQMLCIERDVLHTYITRQGRRKRIKMFKRAGYIGRDYDADSLDQAIQQQLQKMRSGFG